MEGLVSKMKRGVPREMSSVCPVERQETCTSRKKTTGVGWISLSVESVEDLQEYTVK